MSPGAEQLPLRPSVAADGWVALSGQIGDVEDVLVEGGVGPQTRQALHHLETELSTHGMGLADVVKLNVFLTDMTAFGEMNAAYAQAFPSNPPARTAVAVRALPLDALVEIEGWAFRRGRSFIPGKRLPMVR